MDGRRFDTLSKSLATAIPRRTAVAGFTGGLLAVLGLGFIGASHTLARPKQDHCANEGQQVTTSKACCFGLIEEADGRCSASTCPAIGQECNIRLCPEGCACTQYPVPDATYPHYACSAPI